MTPQKLHSRVIFQIFYRMFKYKNSLDKIIKHITRLYPKLPGTDYLPKTANKEWCQ